MSYDGPERRKFAGLTEEEVDYIAEKAAERALEKVYASVGKNVVRRIMWLVGAAALGVIVWLGSEGISIK